MIAVGRHINGITLNPLEYILDDRGRVKQFINKDSATEYLKEHGVANEVIEHLVFEEAEPASLKIGRYITAKDDTEEIIEREFYGQGDIFKDYEAYENSLDKVCYIPELSDAKYTRKDFLELCDNQESLAKDLFDRVDWQHPECLLEEDYVNGEYADCEKCGRMFACYEKTDCPHCRAPYKPATYGEKVKSITNSRNEANIGAANE